MDSMSLYCPEDAHIKLKVTGSAEKVAFFHWAAGVLDADYPMAPPRLRRRSPTEVLCDSCNGLIYYTPMLSPQQLKILGKQINDCTRLNGHLKVKVLMYNLKCDGKPMQIDTAAAAADAAGAVLGAD